MIEDILLELGAKPEPEIVRPIRHIPDNKIIVVTGNPRSGTSMTMQLLRVAGVPIHGRRFPMLTKNKIDKEELSEERIDYLKQVIKHNPNGFYETPEVVSGIHYYDEEKYGGKAIKIVLTGLPKTDSSVVSQYIWCLRPPREIAASQRNLITSVELTVAQENSEEWIVNSQKTTARTYINTVGDSLKWLCENPHIMDKFNIIKHKDLILNTKNAIENISKKSNLKLTKKQIDASASTVDSTLYRYKNPPEWSERVIKIGQLADEIYEAVVSFDLNQMRLLVPEISHVQQQMKLENEIFIDKESSMIVSPDFMRMYLDEETGPKLKAQINEKTKLRKKQGILYYNCKYYKESEEKYTIKTPEDLPDVTRNKVACGRDKDTKTIEQCYKCWNKGWTTEKLGHQVYYKPRIMTQGNGKLY